MVSLSSETHSLVSNSIKSYNSGDATHTFSESLGGADFLTLGIAIRLSLILNPEELSSKLFLSESLSKRKCFGYLMR